ncbi:hypothetical protein BGX38DRAFT_1210688 [Terfezia claveryi]|nr:hypothetical protein BGX38DRAFT_1210688 [Terfezia claveryi]
MRYHLRIVILILCSTFRWPIGVKKLIQDCQHTIFRRQGELNSHCEDIYQKTSKSISIHRNIYLGNRTTQIGPSLFHSHSLAAIIAPWKEL